MMTALQKLEANEMRDKIFRRDSYTCQRCGKSVYEDSPQLAHRVSRNKMNLKKYGSCVINHELNMVSVCSLRCNDSMNIGFNPVKTNELVEKIRDALLKE
jgi:5-methylcytosine-specific restriction endonuclease McrA